MVRRGILNFLLAFISRNAALLGLLRDCIPSNGLEHDASNIVRIFSEECLKPFREQPAPREMPNLLQAIDQIIEKLRHNKI
jgi:hypothetical protein